MDNIAGPPVDGGNFFGREAEVAAFKVLLVHHDVLLLGPRRIGKTSFARAVLKAVAAEGWQAIEINVASCADEQAFVAKLAKAIEAKARSMPGRAWGALRDAAGELLGRIDGLKLSVAGAGAAELKLKGSAGEEWSSVAGAALRLLGKADRSWLIYLDELPIYLYTLMRGDAAGGVQRVRRFLDWFRNDVRSLPDGPALRWLITGSVGLDTLVQRHGMADTINSLKHEGLEPFSDAQAAEMVGRLAASYALALDAGDAQALVQAVQWPQPYYLQLVFHFLRKLAAGAGPGRPARELIVEAVERAVAPGADNDFHHWEERLSMQLGRADADHAVAMLTLAAQSGDGARAEALYALLQQRMPDDADDAQRRRFVEMRDILLRDGYWWPEERAGARRYRFRLELLRLWWQRRYRL